MSLSNILPTEGVALPIFQEWKRLLIENLQNNSAYKICLPGGLYSTWLPKSQAENGLRIEKLHIDDSKFNHYTFK